MVLGQTLRDRGCLWDRHSTSRELWPRPPGSRWCVGCWVLWRRPRESFAKGSQGFCAARVGCGQAAVREPLSTVLGHLVATTGVPFSPFLEPAPP